MFRKTMVLTLAASVLFSSLPRAAVSAELYAEEGAVLFEAGADYPVAPAGKRGQRVVVRALVRPSGKVRERAPLAVALVLDKSGSMASDGKMENAKKGALEALKMLDSRDVAAVVVYDDGASVLVRARTVGRGEDDPAFYRAIQRLRPGGSTALYHGTVTGAAELQPFIDEGYIPRIVLLSDGIANVGPSSTEDLAALGRNLSRQDITITTIGLGLDYNEDLMTALAAESGGNAYFARHGGMLPEIFARDLEDAVTVTARKVRVTLRCPEGVRPVRVIGRQGKVEGSSLEVAIDNLYGGEKYALFEVELPEGQDGTVLKAAELEVEYADAASGTVVRKNAELAVSFSGDAGAVEKNRRSDILSQAELARNAEIREAAVRLADEGKAREAAQLLDERTKQLQAAAPAAGSAAPKLEQEAGYFEELAESLLEAGVFSSSQRKAVLNDAYTQKNQQAPVSGDVEDEEEK